MTKPNLTIINIPTSKIRISNPYNETGKSKYTINELYFDGQNYYVKPYKKYDRTFQLNPLVAKWTIEGKYKI